MSFYLPALIDVLLAFIGPVPTVLLFWAAALLTFLGVRHP